MDTEAVATEVATVDEAVMKLLPFISTAIAFVPGAQVAAPFMPLVAEALQVLDNAAKAVAAGNMQGGVQDILQEVMNHLTPGKPNSPILSVQLAPSA